MLAAGYVLVNNSFDPNNEVNFFDQDAQEYKLTFKHGQEEVTAENLNYDCQLDDVQIKGKQVVHYTGTEKEIPDNVFEVTFNRKIIYDKVAKQRVLISTWQPEKQSLPLVATPAILDYTPDKAVIGGEAATIQKLKHEYVVTYLPNKKNARRQKAEIKFIDLDQDNQELASSGELKGKPGKDIPYSTAEVWKELINKGYEVVYNAFDGDGVTKYFDDDDNTTQQFTVALKLKEKVKTPDPIVPDPETPAKDPETPAEKLTRPEQPVKQTVNVPTPQKPVEKKTADKKEVLPQTGADNNEAATILGAAAAAIGMTSLIGAKRRKKDDK